MKLLRGPIHENWPVYDPHAAPPGEYGLKSGKNGHLARANGAIDDPAHLPLTSLAQCVYKRRQAVRAAGWPGWWFWGVELHQRRHSRREPLLQSEYLRKTRGAQALRRRCVGGPGRDGRATSLHPVALMSYPWAQSG
jgi:hypothetical protein